MCSINLRLKLKINTIKELKQKHAVEVTGVPCDVSHLSDLENLCTVAVETLGRVDILINNAGVSSQHSFDKQPLEDLERLVHTNYLGALQSTNPDVAPTLKDESAGLSGAQKRFSLRNILVVTQVAISMVLLLGSGLFLRSLQSAHEIDLGFTIREGGLVWLMAFGDDMGEDDFRFLATAVEERALSTPGVEKVALAEVMPLGIAFQTSNWDIPGVEPPSGEEHHEIAYQVLIKSYVRSGQRPHAKQIYSRYRDMLAEFDLEPQQDWEALCE